MRLPLPLIRVLCCVVLGALTSLAPAHAQEYPSGPVRIIVPFAAGGVTDMLGRLVAQQLSVRLGKPFTVENHDGAGGAIGTTAALKSPADGSTLLVGTTATLVTGPILRKNAGSKSELADEAIAVTRFFASGSAVIANPTLPFRTIPELIDYARRNPDKLFYGSAGVGSNSNLIAEYFKSVAKIKIEHVPFRGTAPALNELLANRVQLMFESQPSSLPNIQAGRVRALAVTTKKRTPVLPQTPSVAETPGLESFEAISWAGIFVPAGTARAVIAKLYKNLVDIAASAEVQERMKSLGAPFETMEPEDFNVFLRGERTKWAEVIRVGGITGS